MLPVSLAIATFQGEVSYHSKRVRESALLFDFGRIPQWNCPIAGKKQTKGKHKGKGRTATPAPSQSSKKPWFIPPIQCHEPDDGVYFAQIGPTGGDHGYQAITGEVLEGIANGYGVTQEVSEKVGFPTPLGL